MKKLIFGMLVVLGLVLLLVGPAAAQAPLPPADYSSPQIWHFGRPASAQSAVAAPQSALTWRQSNTSGFGTFQNYAVSSLQVFNGQLYAGTTNDSGGQTWRTADRAIWTQSSASGWGIPPTGYDSIIYDMIEFNGMLYAGAGHWVGSGIPGHLWRLNTFNVWARVTGGWEQNTNNGGVVNLAIFGNMLYAATFNPVDGLEIWRSATGNSNDWQRVVSGGFGGGSKYAQVTGLIVFNGYLYAAVEAQSGGTGTQVWRSADGATWNPVNTNGFGSAANYQTGGWGIYNGSLYVGTRNDTTGGQLWRSADGTTFTQVVGNGFGNTKNYKIEGLVSYAGWLFAFTDNTTTGTQVWRSLNGLSWEQVNADGFGSPNNAAVALWSNGAAVFNGWLFLSTWNGQGGQVWMTQLPQQNLTMKVYLPLVAN